MLTPGLKKTKADGAETPQSQEFVAGWQSGQRESRWEAAGVGRGKIC